MRHPSTCVTLLLAACVAAPADSCVQDPVGHYRMQHGHEFWEEVDVLPDGLCTWWSCRCGPFGSRTAVTGHWRIDGDAIVIRTGHGTWRLHLRQHEGHVYLVPRSFVEWFDANGPYVELCFSSDRAPLLSYPPYKAADVVNSVAPGASRRAL